MLGVCLSSRGKREPGTFDSEGSQSAATANGACDDGSKINGADFLRETKRTIMLHTIEVEIDAQGVIHPMQALPLSAERRGLLTVVIPEQTVASQAERADWHSFVGRLSWAPNFNSDPVETQRKMRDEWR